MVVVVASNTSRPVTEARSPRKESGTTLLAMLVFHQHVREEVVQLEADLLVDERVQPVRVVALLAVPEKRYPVLVRRFLPVLQHRVLAVRWAEATDFDLLVLQPPVQIVILAAPAAEHVRHAVDVEVHARFDRYRPAEQAPVRQIVPELVQARAHVARFARARVQMAQIHRHQVDVVQHQTRVVESDRNHCANVEQLRPIERFRVVLLDDEDAVVNALPPQIVVHVDEELVELPFALPVRHDDGRAEARQAILRIVLPAQPHIVVDDVLGVRGPVEGQVLLDDFTVVAPQPVTHQRDVFRRLAYQLIVDVFALDVLVQAGEAARPQEVHHQQQVAHNFLPSCLPCACHATAAPRGRYSSSPSPAKKSFALVRCDDGRLCLSIRLSGLLLYLMPSKSSKYFTFQKRTSLSCELDAISSPLPLMSSVSTAIECCPTMPSTRPGTMCIARRMPSSPAMTAICSVIGTMRLALADGPTGSSWADSQKRLNLPVSASITTIDRSRPVEMSDFPSGTNSTQRMAFVCSSCVAASTFASFAYRYISTSPTDVPTASMSSHGWNDRSTTKSSVWMSGGFERGFLISEMIAFITSSSSMSSSLESDIWLSSSTSYVSSLSLLSSAFGMSNDSAGADTSSPSDRYSTSPSSSSGRTAKMYGARSISSSSSLSSESRK
uniref:Uncharacterized protein n=1 Tax=Anopheles coluzzii TaxID=1518534 RepID=A0A8W7PDU9_ANOCL